MSQLRIPNGSKKPGLLAELYLGVLVGLLQFGGFGGGGRARGALAGSADGGDADVNPFIGGQAVEGASASRQDDREFPIGLGLHRKTAEQCHWQVSTSGGRAEKNRTQKIQPWGRISNSGL
jgi:hypothetical protein